MDLDGRKRSRKGPAQRPVIKGPGSGRRVKAARSNFSDYSAIKKSAGIVVPEVRKMLLAKHAAQEERGKHRHDIIYPSEMAKADWCPRATYYRMTGMTEPPGKFSFQLQNVFATGNSIHEKWQGWLAETGKLWGRWNCPGCNAIADNSLIPPKVPSYTDWQPHYPASTHYHKWEYKEVPLSSKKYRISGRADGALLDAECLIEIKSMGVGTLRFEAPKLLQEHTHLVSGKSIIDMEGAWKGLHRPLLSHVKQGNIYLMMAEEMGLPFDKIVFLYEFKANQDSKEFKITKSDDILAPMLDICSQIEYALKRGSPPACPKNGCGYCEAFEKQAYKEGKTG